MSSPLLFFIFVIVIDLILKSARDKKKIEKERQKRQTQPHGRPDINKQKPIQEQMEKPESIRGIMSTLREEIEKERQKEIERRHGKTRTVEKVNVNMEEQVVVNNKIAEDNQYWKEKREQENYDRKKEIVMEAKVKSKRNDIREDILRGIIFSEILSEPKSIQNQKRSM